MILITTSRKPGRRTRSFCKDLSKALPGSKYVNRGKGNIWDMVEFALAQGYFRLLVVGETKGNPSIIRTIEVEGEPRWGIQLYITGVRLCREIGCSSHDGDFVRIESENYQEALQKVFSYPLEEGDPVVLEERGTVARFLFEGETVGPLFRVKGWGEIPSALRRQSSLKT